MNQFVHLHVHSEYSLLDGLPSVKAIAERAATLTQPAIALTDHGVMFGAIEFYAACKKANVKPIIGMEAYLARRGRGDRDPHLDSDPWHLLLLAENEEGYKNLMRLATTSQLDGFYRYPRVDKEILAAHSAGLICTSGCLSAEIPDLLRAGRKSEAYAALERYHDVFGDRFYLELQKHQGLDELEPINRQLVEWSRETGLPLIVTTDAHYLRAEDAEAHDILLCVQTGKTLDDPKRLKMTSRDYYLRSAAEMAQLWNEIPQALTNTLAIAERCNVDLSFQGYRLPHFAVPQEHSPETYLRALCEEGIARRYEPVTAVVRQRMQYELGVIHEMGFDTYFLIVWDLIRHARENGIWFNVRGSAASSIVAYGLGVTSIEPLGNHLLFERFLNPDRVSMPDIDLDFSDDERGRMLEYAVAKYGKENVAQIISFGRMLAKAAVRDVGRVLGHPMPDVDRVAKLIPGSPGQTLTDALAHSADLKALYESDLSARKLIDMARSLEGVTRNASTHPAGVIIADQPIVEYAPLHRATSGDAENGVRVTQYAMNDLEQIGLLKIDFLGLATLSLMRNVCRMVRARHGVSLDLSNIPVEDPDGFSLLARGDVLGIFQVESDGMKKVLVEMKPTKFEHIVAALALYRPGPLQSIPTYIKRMHGKEPVTYLHPSLEPILSETYAIMVYQEQVMRIARDCCGFTGGEADALRKAVGKKKKEDLLALRDKFVRGAVHHAGMSNDVANKLFDAIEFFARYAFNRAHAANYATLTCQTAYLKAHYPLEYMWAMLNNEVSDLNKLGLLVAEARRAGIQVLPPDVSASDVQFIIEHERRAVRYGLGSIKNVGESAARSVVTVQRQGGAFTSLADFCQRVPLKQVNRRALECLIGAGALDNFGERAALMKGAERLIAASASATATRDNGQMSLFGSAAQDFAGVELPKVQSMTNSKKAEDERELLGIAFSEDVVERLRLALRDQRGKVLSSSALADYNEKSGLVTTAGVIKNIRTTKTKAKGETMAFVQIEDEEGDVELVLFPRAYSISARLLRKGVAVLAEGRVQVRDEKISFLVERISPFFEHETSSEEETAHPFGLPPRTSSPTMPIPNSMGDDVRLVEGEGTMQPITDTANENGQGKSDLPGPSENSEAETNATASSAVAFDPNAESVPPSRAPTPMRRVGKARVGNAPAMVAKVTSAPPRRRAASVFGTRGSEIVTHPAPMTTSASPLEVAVGKELLAEEEIEELETAFEDDAARKVQERETNENEALDVDPGTYDDASEENITGRHIYIRFKDLPPDTGAAYVHLLMGLFADNPGDDALALVFDGRKEVIEVAAPNGVDYDEISEVVQNIVGEDAVVEILR